MNYGEPGEYIADNKIMIAYIPEYLHFYGYILI